MPDQKGGLTGVRYRVRRHRRGYWYVVTPEGNVIRGLHSWRAAMRLVRLLVLAHDYSHSFHFHYDSNG